MTVGHDPKEQTCWYRLTSSVVELMVDLTWVVHENDAAAVLGFGLLGKME